MSDELRKKIAAILGKRIGTSPSTSEIVAQEVIALFREAGWKSLEELKGWVPLAEDQGLPENPYGNLETGVKAQNVLYFVACADAQLDMLKAGWRKVVKHVLDLPAPRTGQAQARRQVPDG